MAGQGLPDLVAKGRRVQLPAHQPQQASVGGQEPLPVEMVERRKELAPGQVPHGPEDRQVDAVTGGRLPPSLLRHALPSLSAGAPLCRAGRSPTRSITCIMSQNHHAPCRQRGPYARRHGDPSRPWPATTCSIESASASRSSTARSARSPTSSSPTPPPPPA